MTIALFRRLSRVKMGLRVLRKYGSNAHLWLPGVGYINGQQLGNYLDSAGTTVATVDNPVGLVLDQLYGSGALGANLAAPTTSTSGYSLLGTGASFSSDGSSITIVNGSVEASAVVPSVTASAGEVYWVSCELVALSGTTSGYVVLGGSNLALNGSPGVKAGYVTVASGGSVRVAVGTGASGNSVQFRNLTIRKVLGIPASQATTANKPTLRRGVTNLLSYSNDLTNGAWPKANCTATSNSVTFSANATAQVAQNVPALAGIPVTVVAKVSTASGTKSVRLKFWDGTTDNFSSNFTATTTPQLVVLNGVGTSFGACNIAVVNGTDAAAGTVVVDGVGFFIGTLTAAQIQACGGIPLTTTAAASSSAGNWGWQFKAANTQQMAMPLSTGSSGVLFCGVSPASASWQAFIGSGGQSTGTPGIALAMEVGLKPRILLGSASSANQALIAPNPITLGTAVVLSAQWGPSSQKLRVNGAQSNTSTLSIDPTSGNTFAIGNFNPGGSDYCDGTIFSAAFVNAASVPTSEVLAIERMIGALTGPTGVTF